MGTIERHTKVRDREDIANKLRYKGLNFTGTSNDLHLTIDGSASGIRGRSKRRMEVCTWCNSVTVVEKNSQDSRAHTWHFAVHTV
jgi:hypothetical protein